MKKIERIVSLSHTNKNMSISKWIQNVRVLKQISCASGIQFMDIHVFDCSSKKQDNDSFNKKRETIISSILNQEIPEQYYISSLRWKRFRCQLEHYVNTLDNQAGCGISEFSPQVKCILKAGRNNNNDFTIVINSTSHNVEFKFGTECVNETPQFVSPMKPSKYLDKDFESWYYDHHLPTVATGASLEVPSKEEYLKTIHNNKVPCMKAFKEKYDTDKTFNVLCKQVDKKAIRDFIQMSNIKVGDLSNYLSTSQKHKKYMCYKDGKLYYDTQEEGLYTIKEVVKRENTNYICLTESGMKLEVKLRFKNGCGLQFPAFQIKRKIPSVKELKELCHARHITAPRLKKDICKVLDQYHIIY
jgi:hypothetical protein